MNRRTRTLLVLGIAVIAASVASFGVYRAVGSIPVREVEVASVHAVVAAVDLPVGALITNEQVKVVPWPARSPVQGAFASVDQVVNRGVVQAISANDLITDGKLAPVGAGSGLSPTIPPGMRAVSVKVNEVVGVAGFVVPGSRVDVLVTINESQGRGGMTRAVVSNVQVLTSGTRFDQEKAKTEGQPIPATVVTLLATPEDAERITLASTEGKVMLTLRNPLDTGPTATEGIRMAHLVGPPAPPVEQPVKVKRAPTVQTAPPPPAPRPYTIEAVRGGKRSDEVVK